MATSSPNSDSIEDPESADRSTGLEKGRRKSVKERVEDHVMVMIVAVALASAGTAWTVANEVLVKPRDFQLAELRKASGEQNPVRIITVKGRLRFSDGAGRDDLVRVKLEPPRTYSVFSNLKFEVNLIPVPGFYGDLSLPDVYFEHEGYEPFELSFERFEGQHVIHLDAPIVLQRKP